MCTRGQLTPGGAVDEPGMADEEDRRRYVGDRPTTVGSSAPCGGFGRVTLDEGATWQQIPVSDEAAIPGRCASSADASPTP